MFPGDYIHIGCEDVCKDNWDACPFCSRRMKQLGVTQTAALQDWFFAQVESHVESRGKRIIGWDDILDIKDLSSDAVVMSTRGDANVTKAAVRGNQVVAAHSDYCELDTYQADSAYHPIGFPLLKPIQRVYQYDPIPIMLPSEVNHLILGSEGILWTDYIQSYSQAEYFLLPRLCALAEAYWTPVEKKEWQRFRKKIEIHKQRLGANGYQTCPGSFKPMVTIAEDQDYRIVSIATEVENTFVYYTVDGSEPTLESPVYSNPLRLAKGTLLRTLSYYQGQVREGVYNFPL